MKERGRLCDLSSEMVQSLLKIPAKVAELEGKSRLSRRFAASKIQLGTNLANPVWVYIGINHTLEPFFLVDKPYFLRF